jgi:hypothetical protein
MSWCDGGWSIDHYLAARKHNADAAEIARLAPIEAEQQKKVHELRRKLLEEKAKHLSGQNAEDARDMKRKGKGTGKKGISPIIKTLPPG